VLQLLLALAAGHLHGRVRRVEALELRGVADEVPREDAVRQQRAVRRV
jgi:hypothetical protein